MAEYSVDIVFERVLKREMDVLLSEKSKSCRSGAVMDLATDRLIEAYYLKTQYEEMQRGRDFEKRMHRMEKEERERYQKLLREARTRK